jgi:long-chain acyl-CoA synthetase
VTPKAPETLPKLLDARAAQFGGGKVALREKEYGIWQETSWSGYRDHVRDFSLGLRALGLGPGEKVAVIGDNRPEWLYAELAAQAAGGVSVGLYQDSVVKEVTWVARHCDARFIVAEDQEQVDKFLDAKADLPGLVRIIYADPRGMRGYADDILMDFREVEELGRRHGAAHPGLYEEGVARGKGGDLALIAYTSGTTGFPKGTMLTHRNMLAMATNLMSVDPKYPGDEFVSFLPLAWIGEQMMAVSSALAVGFTVNFPEEPETVQNDLREIGPHVLFSPPRIWENLSASVRVKVMDASSLKRFVFERCMPIGTRMADYRFRREKPPLMWRALYFLAYQAVFRAIKDRLGFSRIRSASTGGAALGPDTFRFFHALGVNLKQIYGQTEIAGISCIHPNGEVDFETVGRPIPDTDIRITADGEIVSRSPSVFQGYYKDDAATAEVLREGWLHSGDAGYLREDGQLVVIDRVKDLMQLTDGTRFSPQFIENKLKFSPYIKEAVAFGHERDRICVILNIDMGIVGKWAEDRLISYTTYTDLSSKPEIYELMEREARRVNESLPASARISRFVLLYKELDADDDELTRTKKVRRRFIGERYREVVEAMYAGDLEVPIDALIKYQDGRTTRVRTVLSIRDLGGAP